MADEEVRANATGESTPEEEFTPIGTLVLTVIYIVIFATSWGLVYFTELLPRR